MNDNIRDLLHSAKKVVVFITNGIASITPKSHRLIMFSAWNAEKYSDSSMYMYEYLLNNKDYKVVWYTKNKDVYEQLKREGKPVVCAYTLKAIWMQCRATMLVSAVQLGDFNPYFLGKCIYFDLDHGFPIKQCGYENPEINYRKKDFDLFVRKHIDYYMSASSDFCERILARSFCMNNNKMVFCNKPRTDVLFDPELRKGKNLKIENLRKKYKIIVYAPTHRLSGSIPIHVDKIMNFDEVEKLCEKNNAVFIIKKHFFHRREKENTTKYPRIYDLTSDDIETQTLLYQADILITDYSAIYIDYLLLNRPILFYLYDYEEYKSQERDLYFDFDENNSGYKSYYFNEFIEQLDLVCSDWADKTHEKDRLDVRYRYFDKAISVGDTRATIAKIMENLIDGTYVSKWK